MATQGGAHKPKVMDAVHPPSSAPTPAATGRPVIVSNRSYIKNDPMLNVQSDPVTPAKTEPEALAAEQPTPAEQVEPKAPKLQLVGEKKIQPLSAQKPEESTPEVAEAPAEDTAPISAEPKEEKPAEPAEQPAPVETPTTEESDMAAKEAALLDAQLAPQAVPDTSEDQVRNEELERMIAAGTYAVPLNRKKRRRAWLAWTIIITIVVAIIVVDVLADMGVFTLPFGIPSTDFFVK